MRPCQTRLSCPGGSMLAILLLTVTNVCAEDWPQWRGNHRDATIEDSGLMSSLPEGTALTRKWSVPIGPGYSGPTIANGRVYITDRQGDQESIRERIVCLDESTGAEKWVHEYPVQYSIGYAASGPRAAVTIADGKAFAVGGMGLFHCLDANEGDVIWKRDLNSEHQDRMPIWGITAAPLVYQDLVIQIATGAEDACVFAMDKETGKERWRALNEKAGYSAPIVVRQGDQDVLVCWTGESVSGLNPKSGDVFWSVEMLPRNMPIGVPTPVLQGDKLFVSSFYDGSLLIQLDQSAPKATKLWHRVGVDEKNTDALHCMISNPILKGDAIYGFDSYGELRCLDLETGDRIWEDLSVVPRARWATVHTIRNGDTEIMLNDQGELVLANLDRSGLTVQGRAPLIDRTRQQLNRRGGVVWAHPAIANGSMFARNDKEVVCVSLRQP